MWVSLFYVEVKCFSFRTEWLVILSLILIFSMSRVDVQCFMFVTECWVIMSLCVVFHALCLCYVKCSSYRMTGV